MTANALAIRHVPFEDLGLLAPVLDSHGYRVSYLDAGIDPITARSLLDPDLLIVLGGPIGVYETTAYPSLSSTKDAIAARLAAGRSTLGICLGAQLLASALGADVRATGRKEIGYSPITLTPEGQSSALGPLDGVPVLHWHGDEFSIPAGASRLAFTPGFPNQAFSLHDNVLALQFHLEADHAQFERWLIGHAHELSTAGIDPRRLRKQAAAYGPHLADIATNVLNDWLSTAADL